MKKLDLCDKCWLILYIVAHIIGIIVLFIHIDTIGIVYAKSNLWFYIVIIWVLFNCVFKIFYSLSRKALGGLYEL